MSSSKVGYASNRGLPARNFRNSRRSDMEPPVNEDVQLQEKTSAPPRCLDCGDVDLLHRHHRREGTLCLTASSRKRISERARRDLPGQAPAILAPTALTFLAAVADDGVPVAVGLFLSVRRDLEGKGLAVL